MAPMEPAIGFYLDMPGYMSALFTWLILVLGLSTFCYVMYRRYLLLRSGTPDPRFSMMGERIKGLFLFGFLQKRQIRYPAAGVIHLIIFWGFLILGLHSVELLAANLGLPLPAVLVKGRFYLFYDSAKDVFELLVLGACVWAVLRRAIAKPARYEGVARREAYLILALIASLMITDMFFEGSGILWSGNAGAWLPAARIAAFFIPPHPHTIKAVHFVSYLLFICIFFLFLNYLPLSKHFHIITVLPSLFFRRLTKGSIKPARWDIPRIEEIETLGVEKVEDFTWKQILDLFTCTECGRCSDNCPAKVVGRPLSPMAVGLKLRAAAYSSVPVFGLAGNGEAQSLPLAGNVVWPEELWSCTTCGACEEECPVHVEHIDRIIDMRRQLIETSRNPHVFNEVLTRFEKYGNPFGRPPEEKVDWTAASEVAHVRVLKLGDEVDTLFLVDSQCSFDPRSQRIAAAIASAFGTAGVDFGILGPLEKDSGHQVRRIGEEGLFQMLLRDNMEVLSGIRFNRIVTADPHAFNTLKKDYPGSFRVCHYSELLLELLEEGRLTPARRLPTEDLYTYHDPCYLGRHNGLYDVPRKVLGLLPGLRLVEMDRCRDRSFCCGGGDVALWHEAGQEEMRMAEKRIRMAGEAGGTIVITACPFCLLHLEDAVKTVGFEDRMKVMDLMELTVSLL